MRTLFASAARFLSASDTLWSSVSGTLPFGHLSTLAVLWSLPCEKGEQSDCASMNLGRYLCSSSCLSAFSLPLLPQRPASPESDSQPAAQLNNRGKSYIAPRPARSFSSASVIPIWSRTSRVCSPKRGAPRSNPVNGMLPPVASDTG